MRRLGRLIATALVGVPLPVLAQDAPPPNAPAPGPGPEPGPSGFSPVLSFSLAGAALSQFEAGIDSGGDYSVTRAGARLGLTYIATPTVVVSAGIRGALHAYDFSGSTGFGGADPWDDIGIVDGDARLVYILNPRWSVFGAAALQYAGESGADLGDSFTAGGGGGVRYAPSERFSLGVGLFTMSRIEDEMGIYPIFDLEWRFADDWVLRTTSRDPANEGRAGLEVGWTFIPDWELAAGAYWAQLRFRLDEDGATPGGIGEETAYPVFGRLSWSPSPRWRLSLLAGSTLGGQLLLEDSGGNEVMEDDTDAAWFVALAGRVEF